MSITIDMTTPEVDRQISVLKEFPELAEKRYRPVLNRDTESLWTIILPHIPFRTGKAQEAFGSKVSGKAFTMKGLVGWYDTNDPWYPNVLEYGAVKHTINVSPKDAKVLAFNVGGGKAFSMGHTIQHPGVRSYGFMAGGLRTISPIVENDLAQANEAIITDLAAI